MKVITFAQSKGGSGKSTSCLITAQVLSKKGYNIAVLDADPNEQLVKWQKSSQSKINVIGEITEHNLLSTLKALSDLNQYDFVLIDLEGKASLLTSRAILKSDFVVIPMQASLPDAAQANRIVNLIHDDEEIIGKQIKHAFLMARTSPLIRTKIESEITKQIQKMDYPLFKAQLNERKAFKEIFFEKKTLYDLADAEKAIKNAEEFVQELEEKL